MSEPDDQALLAAARTGDMRALEQLLARHQPQIYRFGLRMCRDPEDARDVLQETLLAMARGVRDFRGASSISTWLYTIARSHCIKKRRKSKFAPDREHSLETEASSAAHALPDPAPDPESAAASREVEAALERAIAALDPMYREVLLLRDAEGLTAPEVGEVLGISVSAVKSRLHRARLAVRDRIAPLLGVTEPSASPACPDVVLLLSQHLEGEIGGEVCAEMERHLEGCARCRARCDSLRGTLALCRTKPTGEIPAELRASVAAALQSLTERET